MKIQIILDANPYFENSASSNRWLTLINGLLAYSDLQICLIILRDKQKEAIVASKNLEIVYVCNVSNSSIWRRRWNKYVGIYYQNIGLFRKVRSEVYRFDPDLLWTSCSFLSFKIAYRLRRDNIKLPFFLEMSEFLDIYRYNSGNILQKIGGRNRMLFFERRAIFSYTAIAFMTRTLYTHYEKLVLKGTRLLHLPMTVDFERFSISSGRLIGFDSPYIAFVGVMDNAKEGIDILIRSFFNISKEFPDYKLYLVGAWNYDTPAHLKLIADLDLQKRVLWKGPYDRDKIPNIIQNAELLVLARPDSKQARGGFPTKLGEYLATGVPVCATAVGELPDYLRDGRSVFFADPGSVVSFSTAMRRALRHLNNARKVGLEGRKVAQIYFNKDIQAQKLYTFLSQIVGDSQEGNFF